MAIADTIRSSTETALETVTEAIVEAGEQVLESTLAAAAGDVASSRKVRRVVFVLLLVGAIASVALWRRSRAQSPDLSADARA